MKQDVILAGVGGQGILGVAAAISAAAMRRGLFVKQVEVHGMSQRGGAVSSHLRLADHPIHSDLIPTGQGDLLIAVEPLEALRQLHLLGPDGTLVASVDPFVNVDDYPAVEGLLDRLAGHLPHVLVDAERLARSAGAARAANVAVLGAASLFLAVDPGELEEEAAGRFADKGERVVAANRRAFRCGRTAGRLYLDGLGRGGSPVAVRQWLDALPAEQLAGAGEGGGPAFPGGGGGDGLTAAEAHAVAATLDRVHAEGRRQLFEHEVYTLVQLVGAISPPHHVFVPVDQAVSEEALERFPGREVVLKLVSPDVVHKSDAGAVAFVPRDVDLVRAEAERMLARHRGADLRGVLVVERVEGARRGLGGELFVGIRATRELGPVLAAGLGGVDTEFLAAALRPPLAVARAAALDTSPERFLALFRATAAYDLLAGRARGHERVVSDGELLRCFRAFHRLAVRFCVDRGEEGPDLGELEVNPFAFRQQRLVPLDGRGRLATAAVARPPRPRAGVERLLVPRSAAVLGVSSRPGSFGRIILDNLAASGFPADRLWVVKEGADRIAGVPCVSALADLPEPVDLLVVATPAATLPAVAAEVVAGGRVGAAILVPGGAGETAGSSELARQLDAAILAGRERADGGPVFLGPNSLGIVSRPGCCDTLFIPEERLSRRHGRPPRRLALVSQSGAFVVSRMSNLETLDPAFVVSLGNQADVTVGDVVAALAGRDDVDVLGLYVEGFRDLDGLATTRAIAAARAAGKMVVFYKAGRTAEGRSAAAGHTASVAGDYDVCRAAAEQAGALVADGFADFEHLLELATCLHGREVAGARLGLVTNAGFEAVGMADAVAGDRHAVQVAALGDRTREALAAAVAGGPLAALVEPRNPLDLTPAADEEHYEAAVRALLEAPEVDAVVVGIVPLTTSLATVGGALARRSSLAQRLPRLLAASARPLVAVVDSGPRYEPLVRALREGGLPVFRSADVAVAVLGRYLGARLGSAERLATVAAGARGRAVTV